jgi:hypothetical protein
MTEEKTPLFAIPDFQNDKVLRDAVETLREHLSKTKVPTDLKKWKKNVDKTLELLKKMNADRQEKTIEYMREMNELTKIRDINNFGGVNRLQTVPYATGREREKESIQQEEKKRRRKRRKTKT